MGEIKFSFFSVSAELQNKVRKEEIFRSTNNV